MQSLDGQLVYSATDLSKFLACPHLSWLNSRTALGGLKPVQFDDPGLSILDAHLAQDPHARVACEVVCKGGNVILAGEITSAAQVDHPAVVRQAIREIGYLDPSEKFNADGVSITELITRQSPEIGPLVTLANP